MRLVRFENGTYGVRTYWLFGWNFVDIKNPSYEWKRGTSLFFDYCMGTKNQAIQALVTRRAKYVEVEV